MRNLKRVLSLALALVMVLGMMVITTSAADFTDADEITYTEAMDVMAGLGLFKGDDDNNVNPQDVLTRKEAAVLIARIILGDKMAASLAPTKQLFDDVPLTAATEWYSAAVEYCNNINMIVGHDGKFNPDGELTGTAFAKLLLCAMGYDADAQGYVGENWDANINADAVRAGLNIKGVKLTDKLTREGAAQMIFQALDEEMVEYQNSFDKATGAAILTGPYIVEDKFGDEVTFADEYYPKLQKVSGVIDAVDLYYGDTSFDGEWVANTDAEANFYNIGYQAYVWALPSAKENNYFLNAISDVIVTGESLGTNTEGLGTYYLTNKYVSGAKNPYFVAQVDPAGCDVFYNGVYVGEYWDYKTDADVDAVLDKAGLVGAKVDFVDNDNQGKAEAVVITEYTFDEVVGVQKVSASGYVYDYFYVLDNSASIDADALVNVDALSRGDYITFVEYDNYYFVNVLETSVMELDSITRAKLDYNARTYTVYDFEGEELIASELNHKSVALGNYNIKKDNTVVLDEYGYIVYAKEYTDPDAYVLVLDNEDSHGIKNIAETEVAYIDGTVTEIEVACKDDVEDGALAFHKTVNGVNLYGKIYRYEINKAGYTELIECDYTYAGGFSYVDDYVKFAGVEVTNRTTFIDLRAVMAGKATSGTVYNGYLDLPGMTNTTIVYTTTKSGAMDLCFILKGTNTEDYQASFVVFDTTFNKAEFAGYVGGKATYTYTLTKGVLVNGKLVENYVLTQTQKDDIVKYGVGAYKWDAEGKLATVNGFVRFTADTITWTPENYGTLIKGDENVTDEYTPVFVNIAAGEIDYWWRWVEEGTYYCIYDESVRTNKIVYIMTDYTAEYADLSAAKAAAEKALKDYVALCDADTAQVPDVTTEALETVLAEAIVEMKKLGSVAAIEAYVSNSAPYGDGILMIWGKALEIQAAADAFANMSHRGEKFDIICKNNSSANGLYFEIKNFKFEESLKVVLYTAEGKEIGSMTAVPNSHSTLLAGKDITLTGGTWLLAGANEDETCWEQTGSADYLNIPSYATLYIDGVAKERIKITWKDNTDHTHEFTAEDWYAWLD